MALHCTFLGVILLWMYSVKKLAQGYFEASKAACLAGWVLFIGFNVINFFQVVSLNGRVSELAVVQLASRLQTLDGFSQFEAALYFGFGLAMGLIVPLQWLSKINFSPAGREVSYDPDIQEILKQAAAEAKANRNAFIGLEHVLLALEALGFLRAPHPLAQLKADPSSWRQEVSKLIEPGPDDWPEMKRPFTPRIIKTLALAHQEAKKRGDKKINEVHVLLAVFQDKKASVIEALERLGVTYDSILNIALRKT